MSEQEEDAEEPLMQSELRAAWLMCLQAATISMDEDDDAVTVSEFADQLLDEYRYRYDPEWEPEPEEKPKAKKRKKK